ncbi:MAG: DUF1481 domain-containing protein [Vibrio sp.]
MKRLILPLFLASLLVGCAGTLSDKMATAETVELSGGELLGQTKAFYWSTVRGSKPLTASDYVQQANNSWYKSSYKWQNGTISEIIREGKMFQSDGSLKSFLVNIRFSTEGEAIYQRYRIDNQVLPLNQEDLDDYANQAQVVVNKVNAQHSDGLELIQGIWNGETFEGCDGVRYNTLDFEEAQLPLSIQERLNSLSSYAIFVGEKSKRSKTVTVEKLISLEDESVGCMQKPHLIMN